MPVPKRFCIVCSQYKLLLFQKLKLLQKSNAGSQLIDGRADSETALTRLAPDGASSNSVSVCSVYHIDGTSIFRSTHVIKWVSNVRLYVRPSVRPSTRSFFDLNEI